LLKRAWGGVGVSSPIKAGWLLAKPAPWPPPDANCAGATREPIQPVSAAPSTTQGNGIFSTAMATKLNSAIAHSTGALAGVFSVLLPMRCTACSTMAATAGLMP
jgi:hypothetical protein